MKKKLIAGILSLFTLATMVPSTFAAENWRDSFITRIMRSMSIDPTYSELVLTDLDKNGVPEAFIMRTGSDGGISDGFTMDGNTIVNITVPKNVIGACLSDITVYSDGENEYFIGREIPRYTSVIGSYFLMLSDNILTCDRVNIYDYDEMTSVPYGNMYTADLLTNGYPNRTKIQMFVDSYSGLNALTAQKSDAGLSVNGQMIDIQGYTVNNENYYKIRDIAMILRTTSSKFNVTWDPALNGISIITNEKYEIEGGELQRDDNSITNVSQNRSPLYVDGSAYEFNSYNINGNNYFKIRDIADVVGFTVNWNSLLQAIELQTPEETTTEALEPIE